MSHCRAQGVKIGYFFLVYATIQYIQSVPKTLGAFMYCIQCIHYFPDMLYPLTHTVIDYTDPSVSLQLLTASVLETRREVTGPEP